MESSNAVSQTAVPEMLVNQTGPLTQETCVGFPDGVIEKSGLSMPPLREEILPSKSPGGSTISA